MNTTGTSQGLKLTLDVQTDEYMSGPESGSGALVSIVLILFPFSISLEFFRNYRKLIMLADMTFFCFILSYIFCTYFYISLPLLHNN